MRGRAQLKREIAHRVALDNANLPYDQRVLELLRTTDSRPRVLCTASDRLLADSVASELGLFEEVMASDGDRNLAGSHKAEALVARFGSRGFDYAGNELRDMKVWKHARQAYVVNANSDLAAKAATVCEAVHELEAERPSALAWIRALRLHQWLKNLLVFVPLVVAHLLLVPSAVVHAGVAFLLFGICASSVYLVNDLLDLTADRRHPRKRNRPFASGHLPILGGMIAAPLLTLLSLGGAWALSPEFALTLLIYYVLTTAYSLRLKQIAMLDVVVLAALYTIRIIAGAAAIGVAPSFWLLAFSMFFFLSLAILKRYTELNSQRERGISQAHGRGYLTTDYELLASLGGASGYLSVLVLALYINSTASEELYRHPQFLWMLCPMLLYWISRIWIIAHRGAMHDDPVIFAATDRTSRVIFVLGAIVAVLATIH